MVVVVRRSRWQLVIKLFLLWLIYIISNTPDSAHIVYVTHILMMIIIA